MDDLLNLIRREAERAVRALAAPRGAVVTSYDPVNAMAKVTYQVTGAESGWMPVRHAVVGSGWGLVCGSPIGGHAVVDYLDGDINCPFVSGFINSSPETPQTVDAGEIVLRHSTGAQVALTNDGKITATDPAGAVLQLVNNGTIALTATTILVTGNLLVTGDISDANGVHSTLNALRIAYDLHEHPVVNVQTGGSIINTGTTDHPVA